MAHHAKDWETDERVGPLIPRRVLPLRRQRPQQKRMQDLPGKKECDAQGKPKPGYMGKLEVFLQEKQQALQQRPTSMTSLHGKPEPQDGNDTESEWSSDEDASGDAATDKPQYLAALWKQPHPRTTCKRTTATTNNDTAEIATNPFAVEPTPAEAAASFKSLKKTAMGKFKKLFTVKLVEDIDFLERFINSNSKTVVLPPKKAQRQTLCHGRFGL